MKIINVLVLVAACLFSSFGGSAQAPQVPHKMEFAGITLTIRDDARREIQKDVDAFTQSPKHFNIKVERAKTYFPIIEKIFQEENVPTDFKYLVLQESALIPDAVSTSNAVGFWQFKDFTAIEMGLRVDRHIDERMNIVSASRGAARYIKKNNTFFDNWVFALQAYQMGAGAVMQNVKNTEGGARHMEITSKTYWYVKKFLAHKVAYEDAIKGEGQLKVITYENKTKKSLNDLAREIAVDELVLKDYNKWVKNGTIPDDKIYVVLIPMATNSKGGVDIMTGNVAGIGVAGTAGSALATVPASATKVSLAKINGLHTVIAQPGENAARLAERSGVVLADFLKWNDISISDPIRPGQHYFLASKRTRASTAYHKVLPGENLWIISQNYGVRLKKIRRYNRLEADAISVQEGETLWLSARRPKETDKFIAKNDDVAEVDNKDVFNWAADPKETPIVASTKVAVQPSIIIESKSKEEPAVIVVDADTASSVLIEKQGNASGKLTSSPVPHVEIPKKDSVITITVKKTEHRVQAGETLYGIAKQYNLQVMDLVNWNDLNLQGGIKPGQILKLTDDQQVDIEESTNPTVQASEIIHEVKPNDTLYSVARKYGVTIKELMDWNQKQDFNVTLGEKLRIIRK